MSGQNPLIEQFVNYLRFERHFSPYTARCYGADLRQYAEYLVGDREDLASGNGHHNGNGNGNVAVAASAAVDGYLNQRLLEADAMTVRGFLTHLDGFGYSAATTARKIATLRSFYKWMFNREKIDANPMLLIRTPKQAKRLPKAIGVEEVERLLSAPDNRETLGARDRAILETLYSTGVRVSELVDLNRSRPRPRHPDPARPRQGQEGTHRAPGLPRHGRDPALPHAAGTRSALPPAPRSGAPRSERASVHQQARRPPVSTRSVRRKLDKYLAKPASIRPSARTRCGTASPRTC